MFGIPGKSPISMTPAAEAQIARLMARGDTKGLRIGVRKGGCAGMEYTMDYVDEISPHDEVVEQNGARVMIAPMAQMFLFGTEIDYATDLLESGFKFKNPNVVDACGCGESIKFADMWMAVAPETRAFVLELFAGLPEVTTRAMMGGLAVYSRGQVFCLVALGERIYIKAKDDLAEALAAEGAERFAYTRKDGRVDGMNYWTLPDAALDDPDLACDWARRALRAVVAEEEPRFS